MYIDAYAVIVQKDMDGGDTLHREAMYAFGQKLIYNMAKNEIYLSNPDAHPNRGLAEIAKIQRPPPAEILNRFEVEPGIYIRHPDPEKWYSNPDATSRDQVFPVIAYCAAYEDYQRLWRLFKATVKRGMFAQNLLRIGDQEKDPKLPDSMHLNMAQFIRAGGYWTAFLYPLLLVYDSIELVGTVITALPLHLKDDHWIPRTKQLDDVDDNNIVIQHLLAARYKPTIISEINRFIYSVTRAENYGNTSLGEDNAVMGALRWYHRDNYGGRGNPEMAELYRPLVMSYFSYQSPVQIFSRDYFPF
jgi:hypothetical protein